MWSPGAAGACGGSAVEVSGFSRVLGDVPQAGVGLAEKPRDLLDARVAAVWLPAKVKLVLCLHGGRFVPGLPGEQERRP